MSYNRGPTVIKTVFKYSTYLHDLNFYYNQTKLIQYEFLHYITLILLIVVLNRYLTTFTLNNSNFSFEKQNTTIFPYFFSFFNKINIFSIIFFITQIDKIQFFFKIFIQLHRRTEWLETRLSFSKRNWKWWDFLKYDDDKVIYFFTFLRFRKCFYFIWKKERRKILTTKKNCIVFLPFHPTSSI